MKARAKLLVERLGVSVQRSESTAALKERAQRGDRLLGTITELEALWRTTTFPDLPARDTRPGLLSELRGTQPSEAMHLLGWLHEADGVPGVVCEMGCAGGQTSALIADQLLDDDRPFWIFDSFEGLSKPTVEDVLIDDIFERGSMAAYEGAMAHPESVVRDRVSAVGFPSSRLHVARGFVPASFSQAGLPDQVAFAYVDFDLFAPIAAALDWLHDRVAPGAIVMVDDYGWFSAGAQRAVDEFLERHVGEYELRRPPELAGHFVGLARL